jgi:hypothetical protein
LLARRTPRAVVLLFCVAAFLLLFALLLVVRMQLEQSPAELDRRANLSIMRSGA